MYELARPAIYSYSIQRGTPHVNLRQKRASLFNSQILVVALIGIFGGLKPKMCVHFSKDWRSELLGIWNLHQFCTLNPPVNSVCPYGLWLWRYWQSRPPFFMIPTFFVVPPPTTFHYSQNFLDGGV